MRVLFGFTLAAALALLGAAPARGGLTTEVFQLENGMTFLLVPRPELTTVSAGWVATVGSAAERPGETGLAHFLEHALFHGTATLGTRDAGAERPLLAEEDALRETLAAGADPSAEARLGEVMAALSALAVPNELDRQYARVGAADLNAFTSEDFTATLVRVPADRLESWFWLESDRLGGPVLRHFEAEREVIRAERRQRQAADRRLEPLESALAASWRGHSYRRPVMGLDEDLDSLTRPAAQRFFSRWYRPPRLTAVLVGPLDRGRVEALARRYFGRLPRGEQVALSEVSEPPPGERRTAFSWRGQPTIHLEHRTVLFGDRDSVGLELLAGVVNSRFGSFQRQLVAAGVARALKATHLPRRLGGSFAVELEAAAAADFDQLEEAWDAEVERFVLDGVTPAELERVRKQLQLDAYRRWEDPYRLTAEVLMAAGRGDWRRVFEGPDDMRAFTSADLQRLARRYLGSERRLIARWLPSGAP